MAARLARSAPLASSADAGEGSPLFTVTAERGFLPRLDPSSLSIPSGWHTREAAEAWLGFERDVPNLAAAGGAALRRRAEALPPLPVDDLSGWTDAQLWRGFKCASWVAHAYVWCARGEQPPEMLPYVVSHPWTRLAAALDVPPVLNYAAYNLLNWARVEPGGPVALGNIHCESNFLGGVDEQWFRLVHVDIEQRGAEAVAALETGVGAAAAGDEAGAAAAMASAAGVLEGMQATLARMGEGCEPSIYYDRVRLPMSGWRDNPALPNGLLFPSRARDGSLYLTRMSEYGETGAQSALVPFMDAALGVQHESGWLRDYLHAMSRHMPREHRAAVAGVGARSELRQFSEERGGDVRSSYNECVDQLERFRTQHRGFAHKYIAQFSAAERGTGGSDFMPALAGYAERTREHLLQ